MTYTITIGSWIYPTVFSLILLVALGWHLLQPVKNRYDTLSMAFDGMVSGFLMMLALVFILAAWLLWALLT